ncbi:MAG TPA: hypothetical protein VK991_08735, partial [Halomonas sp.]|nr:hypothetical protein [Halomonas sp.]
MTAIELLIDNPIAWLLFTLALTTTVATAWLAARLRAEIQTRRRLTEERDRLETLLEAGTEALNDA